MLLTMQSSQWALWLFKDATGQAPNEIKIQLQSEQLDYCINPNDIDPAKRILPSFRVFVVIKKKKK